MWSVTPWSRRSWTRRLVASTSLLASSRMRTFQTGAAATGPAGARPLASEDDDDAAALGWLRLRSELRAAVWWVRSDGGSAADVEAMADRPNESEEGRGWAGRRCSPGKAEQGVVMEQGGRTGAMGSWRGSGGACVRLSSPAPRRVPPLKYLTRAPSLPSIKCSQR